MRDSIARKLQDNHFLSASRQPSIYKKQELISFSANPKYFSEEMNEHAKPTVPPASAISKGYKAVNKDKVILKNYESQIQNLYSMIEKLKKQLNQLSNV